MLPGRHVDRLYRLDASFGVVIGFLFGWGRLFVSQHGRDQLHEDWPELYIAQQGFDLPAEEVVVLREGCWLWRLTQNHTDVEKAVSSEASSSAALYRDVTGYPEPQRTKLKTLLREYTRYVIEEAWPLQRQGLVPPGGVEPIADFQANLVSFEPQTKGQEALHDAAMRQFNSFFEYRRTRLYSVNSGIPPLLWYTVGVGALTNMIFLWLFDLRLRVHLLLGGVISFFLATMISLIALMDHPFRGEVSVSSGTFQLIYDQLMKE